MAAMLNAYCLIISFCPLSNWKRFRFYVLIEPGSIRFMSSDSLLPSNRLLITLKVNNHQFSRVGYYFYLFIVS